MGSMEAVLLAAWLEGGHRGQDHLEELDCRDLLGVVTHLSFSALRRLRQESDHELEARLVYRARSCLRINKIKLEGSVIARPPLSPGAPVPMPGLPRVGGCRSQSSQFRLSTSQ